VTKPKTVLIIDDHPLFREGLKAIISKTSRFSVVGEAGTARKGLTLTETLKPDIVIVDLSLPDGNGIQLTRDLKNLSFDVGILIVSMHSKIDYIAEAFKSGAKGYLVKESAAEGLTRGLESVARGDYFLDSSLSRTVIETLIDSPIKEARIRDDNYGSLTPREQEIMRLLAEGRSPREIGDQLCISPKTVENHRTSIMGKLGLHSTMDLVRYAARLGLIDVELWK
jgi:DNA-binding NarL/FixJ family response regulator